MVRISPDHHVDYGFSNFFDLPIGVVNLLGRKKPLIDQLHLPVSIQSSLIMRRLVHHSALPVFKNQETTALVLLTIRGCY